MAKKGNKHAAAGAGSIRQIEKVKDGKKYCYWEARATVGTDAAGKQQQKTHTAKTQKEAQQWLNKITSEVDAGQYFEPSKMTVKQWFETWINDFCGDKKYFTIDQYNSFGKNHIIPELGSKKLSALSSIHIQKFYNKLGSEISEKTGKPLSAKSIRNIHGILSKCLAVAVQQGLIRDNPCKRVSVPKVVKTQVEPLTEEEQKAFLKAIQGHRYRNLYIVMLFSGMRISEAVGLTWDAVDLSKGTIKVFRQLQRRKAKDGGYTFAPLKNSKTRIVQLSPYIIDLLKKHKTAQQEKRLAAGELWQGFTNLEEQKTAFVFTDSIGRHLNHDTVRTDFKEVCRAIGTPETRVHDLRHTFAVNSLSAGDDFKTVSDSLGHATAAFTLDVYGHVSDEMRQQHARRQQEFISSLLAEKQA